MRCPGMPWRGWAEGTATVAVPRPRHGPVRAAAPPGLRSQTRTQACLSLHSRKQRMRLQVAGGVGMLPGRLRIATVPPAPRIDCRQSSTACRSLLVSLHHKWQRKLPQQLQHTLCTRSPPSAMAHRAALPRSLAYPWRRQFRRFRLRAAATTAVHPRASLAAPPKRLRGRRPVAMQAQKQPNPDRRSCRQRAGRRCSRAACRTKTATSGTASTCLRRKVAQCAVVCSSRSLSSEKTHLRTWQVCPLVTTAYEPAHCAS